MKRKYPKVVGWWVYSIQIKSNGKYYIGISKMQCCQRWQKSMYKRTAIDTYLDEWDSMEKTVLVDNLTKEQALIYEDNIIQALSMNDICINDKRSGLIKVSDANAYYRELLKTNTEYRERKKQQVKQWREDNREQYREYQREYQKQYYLKKKLEKQQKTSIL